LAISFPGQAWIPLPNGIKVLGFGAAWQIIKQNLSSSALGITQYKKPWYPTVLKTMVGKLVSPQ